MGYQHMQHKPNVWKGKALLTVLVALLFISPSFLSAKEKGLGGLEENFAVKKEEALYTIGTCVRKWLFFKLYQATFCTLNPEDIVTMYLQQETADEEKSCIDSLASFLLDPANRIPMTLTIKNLRGCIDYATQKKATRGMLQRAGFPVDDDWNLTERKEYQEDLIFYLEMVIGLSEKQHNALCDKAQKGDLYRLVVTADDRAYVESISGKENARGSYKKVLLSSSHLVRGIFATYLSKEACSGSLREKLPEALMENILNALTEKKRQ